MVTQKRDEINMQGKKKFGKKSANQMNDISKTVFAPVYPAIAKNLVEELKIKEGICIDLGSGPGSLAIAVAKITDLNVISFDNSREMQRKAEENIKNAGLSGKISILHGDVHKIPLDNDYADLIISRGSMFFWEDINKAFREIYRVLKPGGKTYIGGGFGSEEIFENVCREMDRLNPEWSDLRKKNLSEENKKRFETALENIGVTYEINTKENGFWIIISKETPGALP
ncbi:ubiquinone/menaquinone biosynthesis C-methylase UbiE [Methanomicrobium sp. W14]|uniref:class I SAM-dependent methyltransferase n=1 Tax=Methanomicrobium sp. W14 TaxID=2817839 RepID=UPI001FD9697D|nr:class I SAM-dependent methyltransferase [Methanomicrobium sp. W14]MBP2134154.1 ubiquinone/menaquinone biosynthesis C-methylase UbiE [Methanomicrobium sp. W14]